MLERAGEGWPLMVIESAVDRIVRILALSIGIGSTMFMLLSLPNVLGQQPYLSPVYSGVVYVVFFGLPIVLSVLSSRTSIRVLTTIATAHSFSGFVFLVAWNFALVPGKIPGDPQPWLMGVVTVSTITGGLVLPYIRAWIWLIVICTTSAFVRYFGYAGTPDAARAFQDAILIALFSGAMMTLVQLGLRAGREQDSASLAAQAAAAETTAAEALERQRTRYHAFTHDDVLATLNSAARDAPGTVDVVRESARRALEKMDEFRTEAPAPHLLSSIELDHLLRAAAQAVGVAVEPSRMLRGAPTLSVPADVGDALTEAFAEAMRNSLEHADWPDGRRVTRSARAEFSARGVDIVVRDDGRGFAARRVGPDRLGVRLSILQRVNSQPGGVATVSSSRGHGTTVHLTWLTDEARS